MDMEDEDKGDRRRGTEEDGGPGLAYMPFVVMEEILDKLKLLNYETEFCRQLGFKPFSRHYFAIATNSGEQFYYFTSVCAWLLRVSGRHFEQPQEYDDPNATISNLLDNLRQFGHPTDFPPSKLKQGCGEHCVYVIDKFCTEALRAARFSWHQPIYPEEEMDEETVIDDDGELDMNKVEDEFAGHRAAEDADYEEEELGMDLNSLDRMNRRDGDASQGSRPDEILESQTDAVEWKLEVERVLPQLKVTIRTDSKDWRQHVEQMHVHEQGIATALVDTKGQLNKLQDELTRTLEKVAAREKYMNSQLDHLLVEFRASQDQLAQSKEKYRQASTGVTERARQLAEITEENDKAKQEMMDRGSNMTDQGPLNRLKKSIDQIKNEITQMDVRIGTVQHILLQGTIKSKSTARQKKDVFHEEDAPF